MFMIALDWRDELRECGTAGAVVIDRRIIAELVVLGYSRARGLVEIISRRWFVG